VIPLYCAILRLQYPFVYTIYESALALSMNEPLQEAMRQVTEARDRQTCVQVMQSSDTDYSE
jgi:hypothetical protein